MFQLDEETFLGPVDVHTIRGLKATFGKSVPLMSQLSSIDRPPKPRRSRFVGELDNERRFFENYVVS